MDEVVNSGFIQNLQKRAKKLYNILSLEWLPDEVKSALLVAKLTD